MNIMEHPPKLYQPLFKTAKGYLKYENRKVKDEQHKNRIKAQSSHIQITFYPTHTKHCKKPFKRKAG